MTYFALVLITIVATTVFLKATQAAQTDGDMLIAHDEDGYYTYMSLKHVSAESLKEGDIVTLTVQILDNPQK